MKEATTGYVEDGEVRLSSDYKISFINLGTRDQRHALVRELDWEA